MLTSSECTVTGPCGHTTDFELTCVARDSFACAACGVEWHIHQAPPIKHRSGWVEPGKRTIIQGAGPRPAKRIRRRRALAA